MMDAEIQYVSSESGEPTAAIVPIVLWREIESERETAYLLKSEAMRRRSSKRRSASEVSRSKQLSRSLEFDAAAFEDLAWWLDRAQAIRGMRLIRDIQRDPFSSANLSR